LRIDGGGKATTRPLTLAVVCGTRALSRLRIGVEQISWHALASGFHWRTGG
jgi:hypothetical protein